MKQRRSSYAYNVQPFSSPEPEKEANPLIDIVDEDDVIHMYVNLPGVKKEDLDLEVEEKTVIIEADINRDYEALGDVDYLLHEVTYNEFKRRVSLPERVDPEKTSAKLSNGVLEILLSKRSAAVEEEGYKIDIK